MSCRCSRSSGATVSSSGSSPTAPGTSMSFSPTTRSHSTSPSDRVPTDGRSLTRASFGRRWRGSRWSRGGPRWWATRPRTTSRAHVHSGCGPSSSTETTASPTSPTACPPCTRFPPRLAYRLAAFGALANAEYFDGRRVPPAVGPAQPDEDRCGGVAVAKLAQQATCVGAVHEPVAARGAAGDVEVLAVEVRRVPIRVPDRAALLDPSRRWLELPASPEKRRAGDADAVSGVSVVVGEAKA